MKLSTPPAPSLTELAWRSDGLPFRVRLSPQTPGAITDEKVVFEMKTEAFGGKWRQVEMDPSDDEMCFDATWSINDEIWAAFIAQLPPAWEEFLRPFEMQRLQALLVLNSCPALLPHLEAAPALTSFLAAHVALRGTDGPRWAEINAVYERGNIYAVLEWLGLPASPQTLAILADEPHPEIGRARLPDYRRALWEIIPGHPLAA